MVNNKPLRCTGDVHVGGIRRVAGSSAEIVEGAWNVLSAHSLPALGSFRARAWGQVDLAMALSQVLLVQRSNPGEVVLEQRRQSGGKCF
jgi:hypothetical protein